MNEKEPNDEQKDHGVDTAHYANMPSGLRQHIRCFCGEDFIGDSWQDVGEQLDEHISDAGL